MKDSGIYMLAWPDQNEYFYFGQSTNMRARRSQHYRALIAGRHDNQIIQRLYSKYGLPEFEFVKFCLPLMLDKNEQRLLDAYIGHEYCCNIDPSATSSRGWKRSTATIAKIKARRLGTKLSAEHKASISKGLIAAYNNGRKRPDMSGIKNPFHNKNHTAESLTKMNGHSKNVGAGNSKARLVLNLETGIYYDYAGEAAETKNVNPQYLRRMLNGDRKNKTPFVYA